MKVISIVRSDDEALAGDSPRTAGYSRLTDAELSQCATSVNTPGDDEDAVHLNGQDPQTLMTPPVGPELPPTSLRLMQNDIVALAGEWGTWQVVAPVNGSKADIRRREGFDTRVVTAVLDNLTVIRCAGSPDCSY